MNTNSHIKVNNLNVYYENDHILKNINMEIPDKKISVIIGPSGCGKTTLLKAFNSMLNINNNAKVYGEVLIDGENIYDKNIEITSVRKKMGLLLQKPYPLPMSIYDNVAYGPKIHGLRKKDKLEEIVTYHLKEVNLWDEVKNRLNSPATSLSVGQQQRLCFARGLAVEPEIILGDEPTSALDPVSSKKIEEKFLELKNNYTIILVTHILRQAKRLADYVFFLYLGELIEHGPAKEFFDNPQSKLTQDYIQGMIN